MYVVCVHLSAAFQNARRAVYCITVWVFNVSKDPCNEAHNYLSFQNKTSVSGLNVSVNELHISYLDWNYHCKTLGSLCTSCAGTLNCKGSYCLGKYTWGLLIQREWKRSYQLLESSGSLYRGNWMSWRYMSSAFLNNCKAERMFYADTHTDRFWNESR